VVPIVEEKELISQSILPFFVLYKWKSLLDLR